MEGSTVVLIVILVILFVLAGCWYYFKYRNKPHKYNLRENFKAILCCRKPTRKSSSPTIVDKKPVTASGDLEGKRTSDTSVNALQTAETSQVKEKSKEKRKLLKTISSESSDKQTSEVPFNPDKVLSEQQPVVSRPSQAAKANVKINPNVNRNHIILQQFSNGQSGSPRSGSPSPTNSIASTSSLDQMSSISDSDSASQVSRLLQDSRNEPSLIRLGLITTNDQMQEQRKQFLQLQQNQNQRGEDAYVELKSSESISDMDDLLSSKNTVINSHLSKPLQSNVILSDKRLSLEQAHLNVLSRSLPSPPPNSL